MKAKEFSELKARVAILEKERDEARKWAVYLYRIVLTLRRTLGQPNKKN